MRDCSIITGFVQRPDQKDRDRLNWGSLGAALAIVARRKHRAQNRIHERATALYEGGMGVEQALTQATDEVANSEA